MLRAQDPRIYRSRARSRSIIIISPCNKHHPAVISARDHRKNANSRKIPRDSNGCGRDAVIGLRNSIYRQETVSSQNKVHAGIDVIGDNPDTVGKTPAADATHRDNENKKKTNREKKV